MTLYPNNIDDSSSLPPSYSINNINSFKYQVNIAPASSADLVDPTTGDSIILNLDTTYLIRVNCLVVNLQDPTIIAQFIQNINAYNDSDGNITITVTSTELNYNPSGDYGFNVGVFRSNQLRLSVGNAPRVSAAKAIAIVDYISTETVGL